MRRCLQGRLPLGTSGDTGTCGGSVLGPAVAVQRGNFADRRDRDRLAAGGSGAAVTVRSTRYIDLTAFAWTNNTVRVSARNISGAKFDLAAATLSVGVVKRRAR